MPEVPEACLAIEEELSALLDEDLEPGREAELRAHLDDCDRCTRRLEELCNVDLALASLPVSAVPDDLAQRLAARLDRERAPAAGGRTAPPPRRRLVGLALAAAAAVALAIWVSLPDDEPGEALPSLAGTPTPEPPAAATGLEELPEEDLALLLAAGELEDLAVIENLEVLEVLVGLGLGEGAG